MARKDLSERSSARELWAELKRRERLKAEPSAELDELRGDIERAHARENLLSSELAAARADASDAGISDESIAGKPAIAKYRREWKRFANAVLRLPRVRQTEGFYAVRIAVAKELDADLALFELDAPRGEIAARERDRLRRQLDTPAFVAVMARPETWADYQRLLFLSQVVRAYFRPSVWRVYDRATDEGALDRYGTVFK